jgi:ribosomal subunit interface protein
MIKHTISYNDRIATSEELEYHTFDAFNKLDKFTGEVNVDFHTSYSKEGSSFKVHSHGTFEGINYNAQAVDDDLYKGIDLMVAKLESQFRTAKGKRTNIDRDTGTQAEDETDQE